MNLNAALLAEIAEIAPLLGDEALVTVSGNTRRGMKLNSTVTDVEPNMSLSYDWDSAGEERFELYRLTNPDDTDTALPIFAPVAACPTRDAMEAAIRLLSS